MRGWALGQGPVPPPPAPTPVLGMWAWFKSTDGVTRDEFNFVSAWADQSGNNRNCTEAFISGPLWEDAQFNGLPALRFDSNGISNVVDNIPFGGRSLYVVAQPNGPEGGSLVTFRRSVNDWTAYPWLFAGTQYVWSDGAVNIAAVAAVDYSAAPHIFSFFQAGNTLTFKVDSVVVALATSTTADEDGTDGFTLGGRNIDLTQGLDGRAAEYLFYDADQEGGADETQNMVYLTDRYAL